ncbi:MAG: anhydro-N-acetylmuramic acid kinase [Notoacmeibacter sp.]|nr:anhydro-N-acetylmuramic acid kinase [Notoacmeibacter sp.]MCC0031778.1 anhydro-N-acetylmuramic acid kinase [Brucellaceae bacterium]
MEPVRAIGLMSGTSMDGIDAALVETDGEGRATCGPALMIPYEAAFRRRIEAALEDAKVIARRDQRPGDLAGLEREITDRHAAAVEALLGRAGLARQDITVIGFHGQTVLHRPQAGLTVQIGDGARLAALTGIDVVADMRAADMAHGGQGAPLVPAWHAALAQGLCDAQKARWPVAFVNIGGISNITFVSGQGDPVAFDCGPGNALVDQWVQAHAGIGYDDGGRIGSEGTVVQTVLDAYLAHPFLEKPGPKSLDRNDFTLEAAGVMELADGARTLAAVTAHAIHDAARHLPAKPSTWVLCGGGRKNANIVRDLRELASEDGAGVIDSDAAGLDGDAMEAQAWAYLAVRNLRGLPLTWPSTTGVSHPVSGGALFSQRLD